jgi:hypothetical protein
VKRAEARDPLVAANDCDTGLGSSHLSILELLASNNSEFEKDKLTLQECWMCSLYRPHFFPAVMCSLMKTGLPSVACHHSFRFRQFLPSSRNREQNSSTISAIRIQRSTQKRFHSSVESISWHSCRDGTM